MPVTRGTPEEFEQLTGSRGSTHIGPPTKKVKSISLGLLPDDDPIYQGGWNFITGKNLNPRIKSKDETSRTPEPSRED